MKSSVLFMAVFSGLILLPVLSMGQPASDRELYRAIREKDSLLFEVGFNKCDSAVLNGLICSDFIFYHDQSGITNTKEAFIKNIANGLCQLQYKATRRLDRGSVAVHPLKDNGTLYGAIQHGEHSFFAREGEEAAYLTSKARFTHVWLLEEGDWRLRSVLSYDHKE